MARKSQDAFLLPQILPQGLAGSILLVRYSVIIAKPAIFCLKLQLQCNNKLLSSCVIVSNTKSK